MTKGMSRHRKLFVAKVLLFTLFLGSYAGTVAAQGQRVDLNALTNETQKMLPDADRVTLVWWIPDEYWEEVSAQNPQLSKAQVAAFINILSPYTLFVVVDGKIGALGGVTYKSEETLRATIQLVDAQGNSYRPLPAQSLNPDMKSLLSIMKPMLANMLGQMGENMNFIVFPSKSKTGQRIIEARREGSFTIKLAETTFKWRSPLGSLLPPKTCPVDDEQFSGAWNYCPWHGAKLVLKATR